MKRWEYDPQKSAIRTLEKVTTADRNVDALTAVTASQVHATLAVVEQLERIGDLLEKMAARP
jgi:hypothetical protein